MTASRLFGASGEVVTEWHHQPGGDDAHIVRKQNPYPYAEWNQKLRNEHRSSRKSQFFLKANIPNMIVELWMNRYGVNLMAMNKYEFNDFVTARLNEPEWHWLRTAPDRFYRPRRGQGKVYDRQKPRPQPYMRNAYTPADFIRRERARAAA